MKNNKGFTLVELLAVIVVLGMLMILTSTSVMKIVKDTKKNLKDKQMAQLYEAGETYITNVIDGNAEFVNEISNGVFDDPISGYALLKQTGECDTRSRYCYSDEEDGNVRITKTYFFDSYVLKDYIDISKFNISEDKNLCKLKVDITVQKEKVTGVYFDLVDVKVYSRTGYTNSSRCVK